MPPRKPEASVSQDVGLTRIRVDYKSPAVRGHELWGARVPYGELWRTGESPAATISFSRDVVFAGKAVPAGRYALIAIPTPDAWTFVLNKNADLAGGGPAYSAASELTRVKVAARGGEPRERLRFVFSSFDDNGAVLDLEWERRRVSIPVKVDTEAQILADIAALERDVGDVAGVERRRAEAAQYLLAKRAQLKEETNRQTAHEAIAPALVPAHASVGQREDVLINTSWLHDGGLHAESPVDLPQPGERPVGPQGARRPAATAPGPQEIAPIIKKGRASLQACYQRALRENPALTRGHVTVSITVSALGLVKNVKLDAPEGLRVVEPCVRSAVARWVFPASSTEYGAEVPLSLEGHE